MFNFSFRSKIEENVSVLKQKESTSYWEHEILQESIKTSKHSIITLDDKTLLLFGGSRVDKEDSFVKIIKKKVKNIEEYWVVKNPKIWSQDYPPFTRGHTTILYKDTVILFGGKTGNIPDLEFFGDLWVLYTCIWEWSRINFGIKMTPKERSGHTSVRCKDKMYVFGGITSGIVKHNLLNDVWEFDIDSQEWKEIQRVGITPCERYQHSAASLYDKIMVIFGGSKSENKSERLNDCWIFDTDNYIWHQVILTGKIPSNRFGHVMIDIGNGYLFLHGGQGQKALRDSYIIDTKNKISIHLDSDHEYIDERKDHAITHFQGRILIYGGCEKTKKYHDLAIFDYEKFKYNNLFKNSKSIQKELDLLLEGSDSRKNSINYGKVVDDNDVDIFQDTISIKEQSVEKEKHLSTLLLGSFIKNSKEGVKKKIGSLFYETGQYIKCTIFLSKHIDEIYPVADKEAREQRGRAYFVLGEYVKAYDDFISVKEKPELLILASECLICVERYEEATQLLEVALGKDPKNTAFKTAYLYAQACENQYMKLRESKTTINPTQKSIKEKKRTFQLLVIGSPGTGKTTFTQQLSIVYKKSLSPKECANYRKEIQQHILDMSKPLIDLIKELNLKFDNSNLETIDFGKFDVIHPNLYEKLILFSKDKAVKEAFKGKNSYPEYGNLLSDNAEYFYNHAERILKEEYTPIPKDVIFLGGKKNQRDDHFALAKKMGVKDKEMEEFLQVDMTKTKTFKFSYKKFGFNVKEVLNGTKPSSIQVKSETWVLFLVNLEDFDKKKSEDIFPSYEPLSINDQIKVSSSSGSTIIDSLIYFDYMCNSQQLKETNIILIFSKNDGFEKKISLGMDLSQVFPDYKGGKNIKKCQEYLISIFKKILTNQKKRTLYPFFTDFIDIQQIQKTVKWTHNCILASQTKETLKDQQMI